jgi:DNA-binding NtrC family response regulator
MAGEIMVPDCTNEAGTSNSRFSNLAAPEHSSQAMRGVMKQIADCVKFINNHDQFFGEQDHSIDEFEPVPWIWITGEEGVGKTYLVRVLKNQCRYRDTLLRVDGRLLDDKEALSEIFGDPRGEHEGKLWSAIEGFLVIHEPQGFPTACLQRLIEWHESGLIQKYENREIEIADVVLVFVSTSQPQRPRTGGELLECLHRGVLGYINVPPLRDRRADILPHLELFLRKKSRIFLKQEFRIGEVFEQEAIAELVNFDWPDNLRGLQRFTELLIFSGQWKLGVTLITASQVRKALRTLYPEWVFPNLRDPGCPSKRPRKLTLKELLNLDEQLLDKGWTLTDVAKSLGVALSTLSKRRSEEGLPRLKRGRRPKSAIRDR